MLRGCGKLRLARFKKLRGAVFTALHEMQTRSSDENSVRPFVRLSDRLLKACIVTKRKKKLVQIFIPYERSFCLVFLEEEWLMAAIPST